jgi:hypothetical protein
MPVNRKLEIVTLVNRSPVSKRETLRELGMPRSTFYRWQKRFRTQGEVGLVDRRPEPGSRYGTYRTTVFLTPVGPRGGSLSRNCVLGSLAYTRLELHPRDAGPHRSPWRAAGLVGRIPYHKDMERCRPLLLPASRNPGARGPVERHQ